MQQLPPVNVPGANYEGGEQDGLSVLLFGHPGCLDGETTIVRYNRGRRGGSRPLKLSEFYSKFNGIEDEHIGRPWHDLSLPTRLQSIAQDGTVYYNNVRAVLDSGIKPCIEVFAETGESIICTQDHPFWTPDGVWMHACALEGRHVVLRGSMQPQPGATKKPRETRINVYTQFHPHGCLRIVRAEDGMAEPKDYAYRQVAQARLVVEAEMNDMRLEDFVEALKCDEDASASFKYLDPSLEVHHKDENPRNDNLSNLRILSKRAHAQLHGKTENFNTAYHRVAKITKIKWAGMRHTYDVTMAGPDHNFSANGFFVHNTWKTTWSAQWPGVLFLSIASEGGDDALKVYPQLAESMCSSSQLADCPPVFNRARPARLLIKSAQQFADMVDEIVQHHKAWNVCTVVIDSLTYLIDLWIDDFVQHASKQSGWKKKVERQGGEILGPREWGFLNMFLRSPRVKLNGCGLNVIWTCLQKDVYEDGQGNEMVVRESFPMITGATRIKLPGACKLWIHAEATRVPMPGTMGRMMIQPTYWTSSTSRVTLRHKYYNRFPEGRLNDPEWGAFPTFRAVWYALHEYIYTGQRK